VLRGKNIKQHSVDVMIAANAILLNAIVVSDDKLFMELAEIESRLRVENWLK